MEFLEFKAEGIEAGVWPEVSAFPLPVLIPCQTHTCNVGIVRRESDIGVFPDTDALVSFCPGLRIGVRTADCVPVLLYAPDIKAVAAVHAGWKGSFGGILSDTLDILCAGGADPERMLAAFGPSICGECYEVSPELAGRFRDAGFGPCISDERNIDLQEVNVTRLLRAGVPEGNISRSRFCTFSTPGLPSWRRDNGTAARLLTFIRLV